MRTTVAEPPAHLVRHRATVGETTALWLHERPFGVACEPDRATRFVKIVATSGSAVLRQRGRTARLDALGYAWIDADEPFDLRLEHGRALILRIQRDVLAREHPLLDVSPAIERGRHAPAERVASSLLASVLSSGDALSSRERAAATTSMLAALALGPAHPAPSAAARRVERALADIGARLADPALQPDDVARLQGVSRRYLDRAFHGLLGASVAETIRQRRLERAAADLGVPGSTAAEVGYRWGFRDPSHFTRAFKRRFGRTPIAWRNGAGS